MSSPKFEFVTLIGGNDAGSRFVIGAQSHPNRASIRIGAVGYDIHPTVASKADLVFKLPSSEAAFRSFLDLSECVYMALPSSVNGFYLNDESLGDFGRQVYVEKPCTNSPAEICHEIASRPNYRAADHYCISEAFSSFLSYLPVSSYNFGCLMFMEFQSLEKKTVSEASRPYNSSRTHFLEHCVHGWDMIHLCLEQYEVDFETAKLFTAWHEGCSPEITSSANFIGLLENAPATLTQDGKMLVIFNSAKGADKDERKFRAVFKNGSLELDHIKGEVISRPVNGREQIVFTAKRKPYEVMFDRIINGQKEYFLPLKTGLEIVSLIQEIESRCTSNEQIIPNPLPYKIGSVPYPDWLRSAITIARSNQKISNWMTRIEFRESMSYQKLFGAF